MLGKRRLTVAVVLLAGSLTWATLLHSTTSQAAVADGVTERVSVVDNGSPGDGTQAADSSFDSQISSDGTQVAFVSQDSLDPSLYTNACGATTVYVRDLTARRTTQISVGGTAVAGSPHTYDANSAAPHGSRQCLSGTSTASASDYPSVSGDGRYVSFVSDADNVAPGDNNTYGPDKLMVCDRDPDGDGHFDDVVGGFPGIRCYFVALISTDAFLGADGWPHLSADGTKLVWAQQYAVGGGEFPTIFKGVYVADLRQSDGTVGPPSATGIHKLDLALANPDDVVNFDQPRISADGSTVVARGTEQEGPTTDIVRIDADSTTADARRIDASTTSGEFLGGPRSTGETQSVGDPAVSGDGSTVVFDSDDPGTARIDPRAYAVPITSGALKSTEISAPYTGTATGTGFNPNISDDGRYVAFVTDSLNEHEGVAETPSRTSCLGTDSGEQPAARTTCQVVARDLVMDADRAALGEARLPAELVSSSINQDCLGGTSFAAAAVPQPTCPGEDDSVGTPTLSGDGSRVEFDSNANDLVAGDTNTAGEYDQLNARDVFVHTWKPTLTAGNITFEDPVPVGSSDQDFPVFTAVGFGPVQITGITVTGPDAGGFSVDHSCDGMVLHAVANASDASSAGDEFCQATVTFAPSTPVRSTGTFTVGYLVAGVAGQVQTGTVTGRGSAPVTPPATNNRDIVRTSVNNGGTGSLDGGQDSQVSGNGRYDVFVSTADLGGIANNTGPVEAGAGKRQNVYVRDLTTNKTTQLSIGTRGGPADPAIPDRTAPDGSSYDPSISADGRLVTFVTDASNIVQTDEDSIFYTVVVCDRGAPVNGAFPGRLVCWNAEDEIPDYSEDDQQLPPTQHPRLSGDGKHLVLRESVDTDRGSRIDLFRLTFGTNGLQAPNLERAITSTTQAFADGDLLTPVVSDVGVGSTTGVRVAYVADDGLTGIFTFDTAPARVRRIDLVPGTTDQYIGDSDSAKVGNPSITRRGDKVAFDQTDVDSGTAASYISTVSAAGAVTVAPIVNGGGLDGNTFFTRPARAADPAISGDGRFVAYVTDAPRLGTASPDQPEFSCLNYNADNAFPAGDNNCQIVARDLTRDAVSISQKQDLIPDELVTESGAACESGRPVTVAGRCGGDAASINPSVADNGSRVGFDSWANDLVKGDTNTVVSDGAVVGGLDAFVRTFHPTASGGPVNFGTVQVGTSATRTVTVTVVGFGPYPVGSVTVGGANGGDFKLSPGSCGPPTVTLYQGGSCTLGVTFTPSANGTRTGTVVISSPQNPNDSISVRGTGSARPGKKTPTFGGTPNPVSFGSDLPLHLPGKSRTITVTNSGTGPLTITGVDVIDGAVLGAHGDYTVNASKCLGPVAPGKSCTLTVTWIGRAVGDRTATLRVIDNAAGGKSLISLRASVPAPTASANPGVTPPGRVTTIRGVGFAPKRTVSIGFTTSNETATAKTDSKGGFTVGLVIFPNTAIGGRTVMVTMPGVSSTITASAPLLVVLGTLQSPRLKIRH